MFFFRYDSLKPLFLRRFSASWIYCKVLSSGSLNLGKHYSEQVCEWLTDMLKQDIYCLYKRGQWYIQLSLINQSHLKKFVEVSITFIIIFFRTYLRIFLWFTCDKLYTCEVVFN